MKTTNRIALSLALLVLLAAPTVAGETSNPPDAPPPCELSGQQCTSANSDGSDSDDNSTGIGIIDDALAVISAAFGLIG